MVPTIVFLLKKLWHLATEQSVFSFGQQTEMELVGSGFTIYRTSNVLDNRLVGDIPNPLGFSRN